MPELDGSFMGAAADEALRGGQTAEATNEGEPGVSGRPGQRQRTAGSFSAHGCSPWTQWRNHHPATGHRGLDTGAAVPSTGTRTGRAHQGRGRLLGGVRHFQRFTAPLVRDELSRLAREGQRPSQLFLACADSRLVTSMITNSGPGDLFTVRNVGNLVPLPGAESGDESVAAAIEYAMDVLQVESITVCGHSGCGAMQALQGGEKTSVTADAMGTGLPGQDTPLKRWLRHGRPSLERLAAVQQSGTPDEGPCVTGRAAADELEALCLNNIVQQLEHLKAHDCVARRIADGSLELHGMYFHVAEAQAYVLDDPASRSSVFAPVDPERLGGGRP